VASHRDEITTCYQLDRDVRHYEYRLGHAATYTQPEHLTAFFGPLLERVGDVERLQSPAGAIEAYRIRWSIAGSATFGPEPVDPEQRVHSDKTVAVADIGESITSVTRAQADSNGRRWLEVERESI
jgi:hypothetical protein